MELNFHKSTYKIVINSYKLVALAIKFIGEKEILTLNGTYFIKDQLKTVLILEILESSLSLIPHTNLKLKCGTTLEKAQNQ